MRAYTPIHVWEICGIGNIRVLVLAMAKLPVGVGIGCKALCSCAGGRWRRLFGLVRGSGLEV
jgi:hypothetical protein